MQHKSNNLKKEILNTVNGLFGKTGRTPSIKDISKEVHRSKSTVHAYLTEMNKDGMLYYNSGRIRTPLINKTDSSTILSPLVGTVVCGEPQLEEENFEEYVALPTAIFGRGPFFILKAKGNSMTEAGIDPGDLVVVKKQNVAKNGDIIVALIGNETTLKRYYIDEEKKCIRLHPENKQMKDIIVKDCFIQGVAQHIIKRIK